MHARLPDLNIGSAGLAAVVGHGADDSAAAAAAEFGLSLDGHVSRQITSELGAGYELILVMEAAHRREIMRRFPQLSGRTMLFDQWTGGKDIPDPYRKPIEFHRDVRDRIDFAANAWARRLRP